MKSSSDRYLTTSWSRYTASLRARGFSLIRLDEEMSWLAPDDRPSRSACGVFGRGDPVLPDDQGPVQATAQANDGAGRQSDEDGRPGLGRAGLHDLVHETGDARRPDPLSARRRPTEPADGQHWDQVPRRRRMAGP